MKREDFRNEIVSYITDTYDKYCRYQDIVLEIYSQLYEIAKKNNISLYVAYGSLLGVVRDKNMLPWDRDIDTVIQFDDVFRLINALNKELPQNYYFVTNLVNPRYHGLMLRVGKKGYNIDAIHVDVFYAVYTSMEERKRRHHVTCMRRLFFEQFMKYYDFQERDYSSKKQYYYAKFRSLRGKCIPGIYLAKRFKYLSVKYSNTDFLLIIAGGASRVIKLCDVAPGTLKQASGTEFLVFNNFESILKEMYGDYNHYSNLADRFSEFYNGMLYFERMAKD